MSKATPFDETNICVCPTIWTGPPLLGLSFGQFAAQWLGPPHLKQFPGGWWATCSIP